ncbi:MAG: winged helix-turn-helix domain-containing protein [Hyphomonadaceae bacterium]|nr:winged helix-turn-helix domain-containing protein [Hyphomonadaceae bacterium]
MSGPHGEASVSPLVARLLAELARAPGETIERAALIAALWRDDPLIADAALNRLVSEARQAVGDDPKNPSLIQTVPRRGYRLVAVSPSPLGKAEGSKVGLQVLNEVSYGKLAAIGVLLLLVATALKVLLDALIPVVSSLPR